MAQNDTNWNLSFEVLEPVKAPINPHRNVGILIDINDEQDSDNLKLSGSDLDTIKKSNFDLLDLYENIYVTPQHVKKDNEFEIFTNHNDLSKSMNEDSKHSTPSKSSINDAVDSITDYKEETVLNKPINHIILNNLDAPRVLKVPKMNGVTEVNLAQKKKENTNNTNKTDLKGVYDIHKASQVDSNKNSNIDLKMNKSNLELDNGVKDIVSKLEKPFKNIDLKTETQKLPPKLNTSNMVTIKTITLDKKIYAKRKVKTDIEKLRLTKAPSINEKSIVLPQILERLAERKKVLEENSNLRRRLILYSSKQRNIQTEEKKHTNCKCNLSKLDTKLTNLQDSTEKFIPSKASPSKVTKDILNPVIALENCNRERLIAHRVHSAFEKYVLTGSYY